MPTSWGEQRLIDAYRPQESCTLDVMDVCDTWFGSSTKKANACREGARDRYLLEQARPWLRSADGQLVPYMDGYNLTGQACAPDPHSGWWYGRPAHHSHPQHQYPHHYNQGWWR